MISPNKVFAHIDRLAAWRAGEKPPPVTIEWDLTNVCDLGCKNCHFGYTHVGGPLSVLTKADWLDSGGRIADTSIVCRALSEAAAWGVQGVNWTGGGEPTLHRDFARILQHSKQAGLSNGLYTHGGHIDESLADTITECCAFVVVSLDCHKADEYARYKQVKPERFQAAIDGINNLAEARFGRECQVGVSFLIGGDNWQDSIAMAEFGRFLGADYVLLRPRIEYDIQRPNERTAALDWIDKAIPKLARASRMPGVVCEVDRFRQYRDWQPKRSYAECYGIRLVATVTPDCRVWVCPNRREFPDSCLGDLKTESWREIWARHPGEWCEFAKCRAMCRLHLVNQVLCEVERQYPQAEHI